MSKLGQSENIAPRNPPTVFEGHESTRELAGMDLTQGLLADPVRRAILFAKATTTKHDPPTSRGIYRSGRANRNLRDLLVPRGWISKTVNNYCRTVHPSQSFAINVTSGNDHTGNPHKFPSFRSQKGWVTHQVIEVNQFTFLGLTPGFPDWPARKPDFTWVLLYFADDSESDIKAELSLPIKLDKEGLSVSWQTRIILDPIDLETELQTLATPEDFTIDVPVRRRA